MWSSVRRRPGLPHPPGGPSATFLVLPQSVPGLLFPRTARSLCKVCLTFSSNLDMLLPSIGVASEALQGVLCGAISMIILLVCSLLGSGGLKIWTTLSTHWTQYPWKSALYSVWWDALGKDAWQRGRGTGLGPASTPFASTFSAGSCSSIASKTATKLPIPGGSSPGKSKGYLS